MKCALWGFMICLLFAPAIRAQEQAPTLGPAGPSLNTPNTATTTNRRLLLHMNTLYVERIDNKLSDQLLRDLSGSSLVRIVNQREKADAILRGTCFKSQHLKEVHSEIFITNRSSGASVWQDVVHVHFDPPALTQAVDKSAAEIVTHLAESIRNAGR